jgi:hypothetical protein
MKTRKKLRMKVKKENMKMISLEKIVCEFVRRQIRTLITLSGTIVKAMHPDKVDKVEVIVGEMLKEVDKKIPSN